MKSLYIGNLPFKMSQEEIQAMFEQYGEVHSIRLINDRETGRPKGYGFIEMDEGSIDAVLENLNGSDCQGRTLVVTEARQGKTERPSRDN